LHQDNRKLKKAILEKVAQPSEDVPMVRYTLVVAKSMGQEKVIKEDIKKTKVPAARVTISSSRKLQIQEEKTMQEEKTKVDEGKHTFNIFRRPVEEAHREFLNSSSMMKWFRKQIGDLLDIYKPTMGNAKYMLKRSLPLQRKMKNVCRQNICMGKELRATKQQLMEMQEKDRGNLDLLAEATKV